LHQTEGRISSNLLNASKHRVPLALFQDHLKLVSD